MHNSHGNHEILPFVAGKLAFLNSFNESGLLYPKRPRCEYRSASAEQCVRLTWRVETPDRQRVEQCV